MMEWKQYHVDGCSRTEASKLAIPRHTQRFYYSHRNKATNNPRQHLTGAVVPYDALRVTGKFAAEIIAYVRNTVTDMFHFFALH